MEILAFIILIIGIFINTITSRFSLASKVDIWGSSVRFSNNPNAYYITNTIIFLIVIILSFSNKYLFIIVLLSYFISYLLGRKLFWIHLRNSYRRIYNVEPFIDEDGKIVTVDEYVKFYREVYKSKKRLNKRKIKL